MKMPNFNSGNAKFTMPKIDFQAVVLRRDRRKEAADDRLRMKEVSLHLAVLAPERLFAYTERLFGLFPLSDVEELSQETGTAVENYRHRGNIRIEQGPVFFPAGQVM